LDEQMSDNGRIRVVMIELEATPGVIETTLRNFASIINGDKWEPSPAAIATTEPSPQLPHHGTQQPAPSSPGPSPSPQPSPPASEPTKRRAWGAGKSRTIFNIRCQEDSGARLSVKLAAEKAGVSEATIYNKLREAKSAGKEWASIGDYHFRRDGEE
jgi:hypothetical protein